MIKTSHVPGTGFPHSPFLGECAGTVPQVREVRVSSRTCKYGALFGLWLISVRILNSSCWGGVHTVKNSVITKGGLPRRMMLALQVFAGCALSLSALFLF
jgi:hypothetical protein